MSMALILAHLRSNNGQMVKKRFLEVSLKFPTGPPDLRCCERAQQLWFRLLLGWKQRCPEKMGDAVGSQPCRDGKRLSHIFTSKNMEVFRHKIWESNGIYPSNCQSERETKG